jgi:hypothetical protein
MGFFNRVVIAFCGVAMAAQDRELVRYRFRLAA